MRWVRNLDLKNKLVFLAAVSGTMALSMACAGFIWHDLRLLSANHVKELEAKAEMLAFAGTSAIVRTQPDVLFATIDAIKFEPSIESICVFGPQDEIITKYPANARIPIDSGFVKNETSHRYTTLGELELYYPIIDHEHYIGGVYLKADMSEFRHHVYDHATMIVALTLCSLAFAIVCAYLMQSMISKPILSLADAARQIAINDDYTIRAKIDSRDELGTLYAAFNRMVTKIQVSQSELKTARDELEIRVEQRTRQLQNEIVRREETQRELVRAKESAETASAAKSRFLANISHEIRTPLNGILGFAEYALTHDRTLPVEERRNCLMTIRKSGEGLLVLINDLLDLSKIEAGKMEFEKIQFSPVEVLFETLSILGPRAREKGLTIDCRWDGDVPQSIESDPLRFRQVLLNLIGNAVKFTEKGRVEIVIRLVRELRQLQVDVIDTGVGIPEETQKQLFNPFTQGDESVTRRFGGTGLGLSICKSIVRELGGSIQLSSETGKGSQFTFSIDAGRFVDAEEEPTGDTAAFSKTPAEDPVISLLGKRILVADDGETNRKLVELLLGQTGAAVVCVENGLQAVTAVRQSHFDIILMDMQMPVMDGYTATRQLRSEGFTRPIMALTAHAMQGDKENCLEAGCSEFITKPIRQDRLLSKIAGAMRQCEQTGIGSGDSVYPSHQKNPYVSELPLDDPAFAEIVALYVGDAQKSWADFQMAIAASDATEVARLAHKMCGSSGMVGFSVLSDYARALENAARNDDWTEIQVAAAKVADVVKNMQAPILTPV